MKLIGYSRLRYTKKNGSEFSGYTLYFTCPSKDGVGDMPCYKRGYFDGRPSRQDFLVNDTRFAELGISSSDIGLEFDVLFDEFGNISQLCTD